MTLAMAGAPRFIMYVSVSLVAVFSAGYLIRKHGLAFTSLFLLCGAAFGVGAFCFWFRAPNVAPGVFGWHELWHLAVLLGAAFHWVFMVKILSPDAAGDRASAAAAPAALA